MSKLSNKELASVILQLSSKVSSKRLSKDVANYLASERRTSDLDAIMREVARQRQEADGVTEVTATSAYPLSDNARRELKKLLGIEKAVVNEVIDKDTIGGVRMETSETMLDLTVRNRLNQLKRGVKQEV